ncbi:hypothetical protein Leryth_025769 [Lithospermum erythrorhizon]|nr:hypothetical protein Leryth_025769 [Lithospermum erythrorhizon]
MHYLLKRDFKHCSIFLCICSKVFCGEAVFERFFGRAWNPCEKVKLGDWTQIPHISAPPVGHVTDVSIFALVLA